MAQDTSIIAAGTVIRGRISAEGDLEIHGHIEGSVTSGGTVTVGSEGLVKSDIEAQNVFVAGAVAGNLRGLERVVLEDGARVVGDVSAPSIGIRPGAKLRGRVATAAFSPGASGVASRVPAEASRVAGRRAGAAQASPSPRAVAPVAVAPVTARNSVKPPVPVARPAVSVARPAVSVPLPKAAVPLPKAAVKAAPEPIVPALQKRTKKAVKRRAR